MDIIDYMHKNGHLVLLISAQLSSKQLPSSIYFFRYLIANFHHIISAISKQRSTVILKIKPIEETHQKLQNSTNKYFIKSSKKKKRSKCIHKTQLVGVKFATAIVGIVGQGNLAALLADLKIMNAPPYTRSSKKRNQHSQPRITAATNTTKNLCFAAMQRMVLRKKKIKPTNQPKTKKNNQTTAVSVEFAKTMENQRHIIIFNYQIKLCILCYN